MDSFCDFQHKANSQDDGNPGHWDLALFVSGLNFYALDPNGQSNMVTMGLARFSLTKNILGISEKKSFRFFCPTKLRVFVLKSSSCTIHCGSFRCKMPFTPFRVDLKFENVLGHFSEDFH